MKRLALATAAVLALLAGTAAALDRMFPPDLSRLDTVATEIVDRDGRTLDVLPAPGGVWRFRTTVDDVSPDFVRLLVRTEDRRFWWHPGVDPISLARAALQIVRAGRIVSGGSTLTMQAVRLLHPRPRTPRAKLIECLRAMQLEVHFSKRDILGIWLTLAPYGGNLEGVRAASLAWFGASARMLDPAQAALLIAIPRRPEALRPDRHPDRARILRDRILGETMLPETLPTSRLPMPHHAPQVLAVLAGGELVRTTLDLGLQTAVERLARDRLRTLPERASLAMLVADTPTREIRAIYAGDAGSAARAGALDLTRAVRSPGSALKPFLYALAFQDGIVTPQTQMTDLPRGFGGYAPENADLGHAGSVTAADALRRSLNLPAVEVLDRLGPGHFAASLAAAGVTLHLPPGAAPSLPLALGGAGTTLRAMAGLYAALATDGRAIPLHLLPGPTTALAFLEPAVARLTADVLTQPFPGGGPDGVAWKTGTSWGGRDAWSFAFDGQHLAAVWVGRPDGTALPGASGAGLALPLAARLLELLPPTPRKMAATTAPAAPRQHLDSLRLLFPPDGAALAAEGPAVMLRAMGGRRPLTFLVDGAPLPGEKAERQARWQPPGPGFYRVTVLDADGLTARAAVRVR